MSKKTEEVLQEIAETGMKATTLLGAAAETLRRLRSGVGTPVEALLTGDPVADASILRAAKVERVIQEKWNLDLENVLEFLYMLFDAGTDLAPMFKRK